MEKKIEAILHRFPFIERRLDIHMREVVVKASVAMILRVMGAGMGLGFNLLLARTFGPDGAGLYYLALSIVTMASTLSCMGLGNAILRFVAASSATRNWKAVKGVYSQGMRLALSLSLIAALVLFLSSNWLSLNLFHKPELALPLRWMSLSVPPLSFIALQAQALRGLKRILDWILVSGVGLPLFSLVGLSLVGKRAGIEWVTGVYGFAALATSLLSLWLWRKGTPQLAKVAIRFDMSKLLQSSTPLFWMTLLEMVVSGASIFFLGLWATKAEIGVYGSAYRVSVIVSMILVAVNSISAPKFAALYKKKNMKALDSTARKSAKLMTLLAGPILGFFIFFPGFTMGLFGPEFSSGALTLVILSVGQFISVVAGSVNYLLMMSGHEKLLKNRAIFMVLFCVTLNLCLIPPLGILGAAIATATCTAATNLIAVYLVWSKLRIWTIPFLRWQPK